MKKLLAVIAYLTLGVACSSDDAVDTVTPDGFDREAMLIHWADNIIVPAYQAYVTQLAELQAATTAFAEAPEADALNALRAAWLESYRAWQSVAMFEIGKAEELNLRNYTNIYPTDAEKIEENIREGNFTLDLPSKNDEQGFPALDYLLYGLADTEAAILARYQDADKGADYRQYLSQVVERILTLTTQVLDGWTGSYRDTFVQNAGSSATGSFNKLVNDYLFYYEKALRAGKIGIPAGVFSGAPLPETVEGRYAGAVSKALFMEALDATQNFFNGTPSGNGEEGESLKSYLAHLNSKRNGEDLGTRINSQFNEVRAAAANLDDSFTTQIGTDNTAMLTTYDQLQRNVVLMKVDMFQALNVRVDFVDADGD